MKRIFAASVMMGILLFVGNLFSQVVPTSCVVHGTVFDWNLTLGTKLKFTVVEVTKTGTLLPQFQNKSFKADKTTGIVAFVLPRLSNAKIRANVAGFDGKVFFAIPDADSVALESLQPANISTQSQGGFVLIREADGLPSKTIQGLNDSLIIQSPVTLASGTLQDTIGIDLSKLTDEAVTSADTIFYKEPGGIWKKSLFSSTAGSNHEILSATHTDALAATVVRGDVIIANGTPAWARLGIGASGTILRSDGTDLVYTTATYPATTTINQILFSSAANTITGLATSNSQVLQTSAGGVPSFSATLPNAVQDNITRLGTVVSSVLRNFGNDILADGIHIEVRNESGGAITIGQVVRITGYSIGQDLPLVNLADASGASTMPGIGLVEDASIANNANGRVLVSGRLPGVATGSFSEGDVLYVSETLGALTNTAPTGTALIQVMAFVLRSHATLGVLEVARGQQNDLENLPSAQFWVGNGSGVAIPVTMSSGATMDNTGALTVVTNANLTGEVTSVGNAAVIVESFLEDGGASEIAVTAGMMNTGTGASSATFWRGDNTWVTPSGSGDVTKVGTPVNDQVGVWTGDGTIEGDVDFTFDGANLTVTGTISGSNLSGTNTGDELAASTTVSGVSEMATAAETGTGTDATRSLTPDGFAGSTPGTRVVHWPVSIDWDTNTATGDNAATFVVPNELGGMDLVDIEGFVKTAGTTGTLNVTLVNITQASAEMLSTALTIDSAEKTTATAATPAVIDTANDDVAALDELQANIDGVHTTPAQGFLLILSFRTP